MSATTNTTKSTAKTAKKSRMVHLRLSPTLLSRFPTNVAPKPSAPTVTIKPSPSVPAPDSTEKTSESNGTPIPPPAAPEGTPDTTNTLAPPKVDRRRRGGAGVSG
ncbi:hypothetical protein LTR53_017602, partial [Teratosphaeriaceae sp. CCFEE 6253]